MLFEFQIWLGRCMLAIFSDLSPTLFVVSIKPRLTSILDFFPDWSISPPKQNRFTFCCVRKCWNRILLETSMITSLIELESRAEAIEHQNRHIDNQILPHYNHGTITMYLKVPSISMRASSIYSTDHMTASFCCLANGEYFSWPGCLFMTAEWRRVFYAQLPGIQTGFTLSRRILSHRVKLIFVSDHSHV